MPVGGAGKAAAIVPEDIRAAHEDRQRAASQ
jgi:uncharacterized protein YoaH (UPF0181 family)